MASNHLPISVQPRFGIVAAAALLAACIVPVSAWAQDGAAQAELRLTEIQSGGDGVFQATLELARPPGGLSGLQFDLVAAHRGLRAEASLSPQARRDGKRLYLRQVEPGVFRVLIVGFNQRQMKAGPLATFSVQGPGLSPSGARPVSIQRALGTDDSGQRVELAVSQDLPERGGERGENLPRDRVRQP